MVTAAQVRAALVALSRLDPSLVLRTDDGQGMVLRNVFHGRSIDALMRDWNPDDPVHQAQGAQIVAWGQDPDAYVLRREGASASSFPWGWIGLTALVLGGTWFAWRLVKNGR